MADENENKPGAPQTHPVSKHDIPFEGLKMLRPKGPAEYKWIAAIGFGMRRLGGVGDSQEEAAIAMLEQVLVSTEEMLAKASQYGFVESKVVDRVRQLTQRFIRDLRALHRTVLDEQRLAQLWDEDVLPPNKVTGSFNIQDDDTDEDTLL